MAHKPIICGDDEVFVPDCPEDLESRVEALEECCEEAQEKLNDHEQRITANENNIVALNERADQIEADLADGLQDLDTRKQDKLTAGENINIDGDNVISTPSYTGEGAITVSNDKKISVDLTDYYTSDRVYTKEEVDALLENGFEFVPVDTLPATGSTSKVYLLKTSDPDIRDMYVWYNNDWVKVGSTGIKLDGYVKTTGTKETYDEHTITVWLEGGGTKRLTILGIGWQNLNTITSGDGYGSGSPGADTGGDHTP